MAKRILVSYLERNKKIEIPVDKPNNVTDVDYVESVFKSAFSFGGNIKLCITFQRFDKDFEEFVDLEYDEKINDKDKLKAVVSPLLETKESPLSTPPVSYHPSDDKGSLYSVDADDFDVTPVLGTKPRQTRKRILVSDSEEESSSVLNIPEEQPLARVKKPKNDEISSTSSQSSIIKKVVTVEKDKHVVLPNPFPLPKYLPPVVDQAIRTGEIGKAARNGLLFSVTHAVLQEKRYPNEGDYFNLSRQIMEMYPKFFSSQDTLVELLKMRMKECRRNKAPVRSSTQDSQPQLKPGRSPGSIDPQKVPNVPPGEDDVSFQRHNRVLKSEYTKTRPNKQIVTELMTLTFPMRRTEILNNPCDINQLLEKYPFLQTEFLLSDFSLIFSQQTSTDDLQRKLSIHIPKIAAQAEIESKTRASFTKTYKAIVGKESEVDGVSTLFRAMYFLIYLLPDARIKPNPDQLLLFSQGAKHVDEIARDSSNKHPFLLVVGSLEEPSQAFLVVDKVVVKEVEMDTIITTLLASYYVFNISYPRGLNNFFTFLEVLLLNLNPKHVTPCVKLLIGQLKEV